MSIQWFPGHMTSARKKAAETLAMADVVVEVLDARLPVASSNPMIHELRAFRQRPCLKLLNKAEMADPVATKAWLAHFAEQPGVKAVAISCWRRSDTAHLRVERKQALGAGRATAAFGDQGADESGRRHVESRVGDGCVRGQLA